MSGIDISKYNLTAADAGKKTKRDDNALSFLNKEISLFGKGISDKKKEAFYHELSILLEAGMDIRSALELIEKEQTKKSDKLLYGGIKEKVIKGSPFSEALKIAGKFSEYEYYSAQIGEETGKLVPVLKELQIYFQKKVKQKRQVMNALSYPVVILSVSIGAVIFMMNFIVPMFADVFKRLDSELPAITKLVISLSDWVSEHIVYFFLFILGVVFFIYISKNKTWFRKYMAQLMINMPFVGGIMLRVQLGRFCNIMNLLIGAKIPLLKAIGLARKMTRFYPLQDSLGYIEKSIMQGEALHSCMAKYKIYPSRMVSLVKVGEEVNQLESFFNKIAQQYNEEVEHKTSILGSLIEPFMIIFLGLIVGGILIAMYLPLFELSASFGK